jgi:hypothetical protein
MSMHGIGRIPKRNWRQVGRYTRSVATARLIILTTYDQDHFNQSPIARVLAWGLKRKRVHWVLHNPANWKVDADRFDAALCWPYGFRKRPAFVRHCAEFERRSNRIGLPVVNSLADCDFRHTWCLRRWRAAAIPCAPYQRISSWNDIWIEYPVILRADGVHKGVNMFLASDETEAMRICQQEPTPPLDLALKFIDTKNRDGYYRKWRSHVVGNRVIPRQLQLSKTWKVNLDGSASCAQAVEEDRNFIQGGEPHGGLVALAAKVLGADIVALDYSKKPDGSYIFWDGNRNFDLSVGGQMWDQFRRATGRSDEDCLESLKIISDAIADLVIERAQLL